MYDNIKIKTKVDKFVVVLVGAPRGIDTLTWIRTVPEHLKRTLYDDSIGDRFLTHKHNMSDIKWGANPDYMPEFHVCCVTNEYDSMDRYLQGEDHTLGGLTHDKILHFKGDPHVHCGEDSVDYNEHLKVWLMRRKMRHEWREDGYMFSNGLKPLNKERWEAYHREHWDWCTSIRFSYFDHYSVMNEWTERLKVHDEIYNHIWGTTWANQYLHMVQAYNDHRDLFDSLTKDSVVLRIRWDSIFKNNTLWDFARALFVTQYSDRVKGEISHYKHHNGFNLSPLALVQGISFFRGHLATTDYWHCFDGPGARLLGERFVEWMFEDYRERLPGYHTMDWSKDPDRKTNYWKYPEGVIMNFLYDNGYTIYDCSTRFPISTELQSFGTLLTDQYRYTWYDWTDEEVEEIRNAVES